MNDRVQQALDGELDRLQLSEAEQLQYDEARMLITGVLRSLPTRPLPDLSRAVLNTIPNVAPSSRRNVAASIVAWVFAPRSFSLQLRPAYAFAAVALIALVIGTRARTNRTADPHQVFIQFKLTAPQAQQVSLAGDFTSWQPTYNLKRSQEGVWTIVVPLQPGVHDYAFVVDGQRWVPDPMAPAIADGFGGMNSRLAVLSPDNRSM